MIVRDFNLGNFTSCQWNFESNVVCGHIFSMDYGLKRKYLPAQVRKVQDSANSCLQEYTHEFVQGALKYNYDWRRQSPEFDILRKFWLQYLNTSFETYLPVDEKEMKDNKKEIIKWRSNKMGIKGSFDDTKAVGHSFQRYRKEKKMKLLPIKYTIVLSSIT